MKELAKGKSIILIAAVFATALLVACGTSTGALHKIQLHTPLSCPCPTIAPLATYPLPGEVPFGSAAYIGATATGSDGNIWLPEWDADKIARVTVGGVITEFPVPTASAAPQGITAGSDGALWFTEQNFNVIGRITTSGVITEYPLPAPLATSPPDRGFITSGPDGNLWFTDPGANAIGVLSTSGALVATYPVPANSYPAFITTGPDNNVWFDENLANKICRITTSGMITEFPIPTVNSSPRNLIVGPDGNIWFPETFVGQVGRITMSGVITEFPMVADPTNHKIFRLATTSDGSMWLTNTMFAAPWDSEIGKFNTAGVETDLWSVGGQPRAMIGGPDGNPWYFDEGNDRVVRL